MATTTTNFGWDIPQSTDLVKDGATAIAALGQDIDTALVDLKGGTTGQVLSKATNTDLDYTWVTPQVGDITSVTAGTGLSGGGTGGDVTLSINTATTVDLSTAQTLTNKTLTSPVLTTPSISNIDAKGDLLVGTADNTISRLAVGSNNQVLTADSSTATGLKWAAAATGGKVLQVIMGTSTTSTSISSTSFTDTSLSATITPSSTSSKVLCFIGQQVNLSSSQALSVMGMRLVRGSTTIYDFGTNGVATLGVQMVGTTYTEIRSIINNCYLDSPATTSATTYKTQVRVYETNDTAVLQESSTPSTLILMEIGA